METAETLRSVKYVSSKLDPRSKENGDESGDVRQAHTKTVRRDRV